MIQKFILFNGVCIEEKDLKFPERAAKYGDGVFESIHLLNGKLLFSHLHIKRITEAAKCIKLAVNEEEITEIWKTLVDYIATKNLLNARIRFSLYRESEGLYTPIDNQFSSIIEITIKEETPTFSSINSCIYLEILKPINALSPYKTCNSLLYVLSGIYAKEKNCNGSIILNERSEICEHTSSNIFIIKDDIIYTPPKNSGCVQGVLRSFLLENQVELGIKITEKTLLENDLKSADEIFVSNASQLITGISYLNGIAKSTNLSQKLFQKVLLKLS